MDKQRFDKLVEQHDLTPEEVAEIIRVNRVILATFDKEYQERYPDQTLRALASAGRVPRVQLYRRFSRVFLAVARELLPRMDRRGR